MSAPHAFFAQRFARRIGSLDLPLPSTGLLSTLLVCLLMSPQGLRAEKSTAAEFFVLPESVQLNGNFERVQLVVTAPAADGKIDQRSADLTGQAQYRSSEPKIVEVSPTGRLLAVSNGKAQVTITVAGTTRNVEVEVTGVEPEAPIEFTSHVVPIMGKAGCTEAGCHASQYGKGGFKLSVFSYAPEEDYQAIVHDRRARRINRIEPAQSLVLLKPTLAVPHGGQQRIEPGGVDYQILKAWIARGAPPPGADDLKVSGIEVTPAQRIGSQGFSQQLRVVASYSDGTTRDVTAWAKYDSMDEAVVSVSPQGLAKTEGRGQAPVMVRFEGQAAIAMMGVPFKDSLELPGWKDNNFIDHLAAAKFRELGIGPSPLCDDATFVRRAFLDCIGTLPTVDQVAEFVESGDVLKRSKLIDRLLGLSGDAALDVYNNEYASYWALKWADLIRSSSDNVGEQGMWALHNWIKESFRTNKPFDQFVRELVMAKGSIYMNGPANYYRIAGNSSELAETTAQLFMGIRMQCAQCHHHPFEKYSEADYYGFAAFFARVGTKNSQEFGLFGRETVVMVRSSGDVRHPRTRQTMRPTPLEGEPLAEEPLDRRQPLVDWLTSPENEFFARNVVNRYMAYLLGKGLVEPIDDMRATNPPSNVALLDALAQDFTNSGFDLKHLIKTIMNSRLYQLSSKPTPDNLADTRFYSHYMVKRLAAEPLLDAIDDAAGVQTKFPNLPLGTRAIDLPDSNYTDYFLVTFGKPRRVSVCECERVADANLAQALHTINGEFVARKLADKTGRVATLMASGKSHEEIINQMYLATICRLPSGEELAALEMFRPQTKEPKEFYEDVFWLLLNSKEFLFVH